MATPPSKAPGIRVRLKVNTSFPVPGGGVLARKWIAVGEVGQCTKVFGKVAWRVRFDFDTSLVLEFDKLEMQTYFERVDSDMPIAPDIANATRGATIKQKKIPELPPECRRDEFGFSRAGVDFQSITRAIAEAKGGVKP